jgi:23S rRNA (uracil1939-C5)-methyltransferase
MPTVQIDRLAYGGSGFGRLDGKACFVPLTAPGDRVEIAVTKNKSSYLEGVVSRIISPADCRVTPPCPVFGRCGGCNWQHVDYETQCVQKAAIFAETMWRLARVEREKIHPVRAATDPLAYRQRIQLKVYLRGSDHAVGFYRAGSHFVQDLPHGCAIARPELNRAMEEVRNILSRAPLADRIPQVDLSVDEFGTVAALFHFIGSDRSALYDYLAGLQDKVSRISGIFVQLGRKESIKAVFGPETMDYTLNDARGSALTMSYSADSFSQVNFSQNRYLVETILSRVCVSPVGKLLDLFCGNGNLSLPLAGSADTVLGLESLARSIELASHNARRNGIDNARFLCEDSAAGVSRLAREHETFDLILLDPPRSGADAVVRNLHALRPERLVYVSCDPPTLGRDLALLQKGGFRVESIHPVDMFPQTYHLESVTFLHAA